MFCRTLFPKEHLRSILLRKPFSKCTDRIAAFTDHLRKLFPICGPSNPLVRLWKAGSHEYVMSILLPTYTRGNNYVNQLLKKPMLCFTIIQPCLEREPYLLLCHQLLSWYLTFVSISSKLLVITPALALGKPCSKKCKFLKVTHTLSLLET